MFSVGYPQKGFTVEKKVRLESPLRYEKSKDGEFKFRNIGYRERRPDWGVRLNFAVGNGFETATENESKSIVSLKSDGTPFQIDIGMNRNYRYFSVGPEIGYFSSTILNTCENEISFSGLTAGLGLYLDGLFKAAYVVPFVSVGALFPDIKVQTADSSCAVTGEQELDGTKSAAMYYRGGLLIGLNWLDKRLSERALEDYGLQNTFLYAAIRQIPSTSNTEETDVGTDPYIEYGLQLEF
ncbi:MAG: hypothetical protein ACRBBP_01740 [Bdellovibrionales bacterium]